MDSKRRPIEWKVKWQQKEKTKASQSDVNRIIGNVYKYFESSRSTRMFLKENVGSYLITENDAITWSIHKVTQQSQSPQAYIIDTAVKKMKRFQLENYYYLRRLNEMFGEFKLNLFYLFDEKTRAEYGHVYFFTNYMMGTMVIVALKFTRELYSMRGKFYSGINPIEFHAKVWHVLFSQVVQFLEFEITGAIIISPLSLEREVTYFKYFNQVRFNGKRIFEFNSFANLLVCEFDEFWKLFFRQQAPRQKMERFEPYVQSRDQFDIQSYDDDDDVEMLDKDDEPKRRRPVKKEKTKVKYSQFDDAPIDDSDDAPIDDSDAMNWTPSEIQKSEEFDKILTEEQEYKDAIRLFSGPGFVIRGYLKKAEILRLYRERTQKTRYGKDPGTQPKRIRFVNDKDRSGFNEPLAQCLNGQGTKMDIEKFGEIITKATGVFGADKCDIKTIGLRTKTYVIGDLHGSVNDLKNILIETGAVSRQGHAMNSIEHNYIFLGDYIDRGEHSFSTPLAVFILKILFPYNVYVLAGNHEQAQTFIGESKGIKHELRNKPNNFSNNAELYERRIKRAFDMLKIGLVVNFNGFKIFCAHAAIPNDSKIPTGMVTYNVRKNIRWKNKKEGAAKRERTFLHVKTAEERSKHRMLHAKMTGRFYNKYYFRSKNRQGTYKNTGKQMFKDFFRNNRINLFIRGHEPTYSIEDRGKKKRPVMISGYYLHPNHSKKILTIHSVSDYSLKLRQFSNSAPGAFVEIDPNKQEFKIHQIGKEGIRKNVKITSFGKIPIDYKFYEEINGVRSVF